MVKGQDENGTLVVKSPTNKKARMKMRDLWSRAQPKEGKDENWRLVVILYHCTIDQVSGNDSRCQKKQK